jgi:hypothetical protein
MTEAKGDDRSVRKVRFNYVKSNLFRVIHTDGATSSLNPNGNITISLYSQRFSIPEEMTFELDEEGEILEEVVLGIERAETIDTNIVREIDIIAVMNLETAVELVSQIQDIIAEYTDED